MPDLPNRSPFAAVVVASLLTACGSGDQNSASTAPAADGYFPYGEAALTTDSAPPTQDDPIAEIARQAAKYRNALPGEIDNKDTLRVIPTDADTGGAWSSSRAWPVIGIHASLLPDGRVMTFGTDETGRQTGKFVYDVWDAAADRIDRGHLTLPNTTDTDIFCSAQTLLPSTGQLLITAGDNWTGTSTTNTGNRNSNLFSTASNSLERGQDLNRARWYASVTTLPNGLQYVQGGTGGTDFPERRDASGQFVLLTDAGTDRLNYWYPYNQVAPDGRIFGYDTTGRMYFVDPAGQGYLEQLPNLARGRVGTGSSAVMYEPHRILHFAGDSRSVTDIDIRGPLPVVSDRPPMSSVRKWHNSAVLPDGRIVILGGSARSNELEGVNNRAEIYDPATRQWIFGATGTNARLYHSTALLLPDASVLVAGGGAPGPLKNLNAEIYYPPYLFTSDAGWAARPVIRSAPGVVNPGQQAGIEVSDGARIDSVAMIRTGSVTHSVNFDQRRIALNFQQSGNRINFQIPADGSVVPPGFYMLFASNVAGVPSVAKIVRVNVAGGATIAAYWTGRYGSANGAEFRLECQPGEVVAGIHGAAGQYVDRVGPRCVSVGASGSWVGQPVSRGSAGGAGGNGFERTCAANQAVAGFEARSGGWIDQLKPICRPLVSADRVGSNGTALDTIGGRGGTARAARACATNQPAYAMYGRSGRYVNSVGFLCRAPGADTGLPESVTVLDGGPGGNRFANKCGADEVLVGVHGRAGWWMDQLGPQCAKVNADGSWQNEPFNRPANGKSGGGSAFALTCERGWAATGFKTNTSAYVNQFTLGCRKLSAANRLTGEIRYSGTVGRALGTDNPSRNCQADRPANGLYGRDGLYVDAIGMNCMGG